MKTAMQLLFEEFESLSKSSRDAGDSQTAGLIDFLCERKAVALEKEKEQIIDAGNACSLKTIVHREKLDKMSEDELRNSLVEAIDTISHGEEYYNEKYKQYGLDDEARQILNNL
jgi:hypothetical protein